MGYLIELVSKNDWTQLERDWDENQGKALEEQKRLSNTTTASVSSSENSTESSDVPGGQFPTMSTPVCKYYVLGICRLANCPFKHTTNVVCRYFAQGFCNRGDSCKYLHQLNTNSIQNLVENKSEALTPPPKQEETKTLSLNDFPSLSKEPTSRNQASLNHTAGTFRVEIDSIFLGEKLNFFFFGLV